MVCECEDDQLFAFDPKVTQVSYWENNMSDNAKCDWVGETKARKDAFCEVVKNYCPNTCHYCFSPTLCVSKNVEDGS